MAKASRLVRLPALAAFGTVALNAPLLTVWDRPLLIGGWPLLPLALFGAWALLIAFAAWTVERRDDEP